MLLIMTELSIDRLRSHDSDEMIELHRKFKNCLLISSHSQLKSCKHIVMIVSLTTQDIYRDQTVITITRLEI